MQKFANIPDEGRELEKFVQEHERVQAPIKKNNKAKIIWADAAKKTKTSCSIVYLHGFTAGHLEGEPWHKAVAQTFGCNLYLARLHGHGLKRDRFFEGFNYTDLLTSAVNACIIGQKLGEHVWLMGSSTGASLALYAAGSRNCPVTVKGLMLVSPLIHFYGMHSFFLENAAGRFLARTIRGRNYKHKITDKLTPEQKHIWYPCAPLNAALELGQMVERIITPALFKAVTCPAFIGYYNKDKYNHDRIVSPHAIARMARQLGTPDGKKQLVNFPEAKSHVICNGLVSNAVPALIDKTERFLEEKAGIEPVYKL